MNHPLLTSPLKIDNLIFKNRIVMPPMVTFLAKEDGMATPAHIDHYKRSSGPGLMIVEGTAVLPKGRISTRQLGIYSDRHIEGLTKIAQAIHANGAIAGIQLHYAGATAFSEDCYNKKYRRMTAILFRLLKQQFMFSGLHRIREGFKNAARRAVTAGFDIIELHCAHGYIFNQFLSPLRNWRIDRYGGNLENRRRFLMEVFEAVNREVSERALLTCRLGIADRHRRGFSLQEGLSTASLLEKKGIRLLDVSNGNGTPNNIRPQRSRYSARLHLAQKTKSKISIPVIGGGGIQHPDIAEQALQDQMVDLIYVGKGMLADPGWARKAIEGQADSIVPCRKCKRCFHFTDSSKCPTPKKSQQEF